MNADKNTKDKANNLIQFARQEFGTELGLSMEQFLSEIKYTDRFHSEFNVDPGSTVKRYQEVLSDFHTIMPQMLNNTCSGICEYHEKVAELLHTKDCVISFNYDCMMDRALKTSTQKRWDPNKRGYGFDIASGGDAWKDHSKGRSVDNTIRLLKVHGSLNWEMGDGSDNIELVSDTNTVTNLRDSIIPPTWFKNLERYPFKNIWKQARKEVRRARIIVVVGYSVPETDLFSKSLLKVEAGSKADSDSRQRFVDVINGGIEEQTTILRCDTFEQLYELLRKPPSQ